MEDRPAETNPPGPESEPAPPRRSLRPWLVLGGLVFLAAVGWLAYWWFFSRGYVSTDDAFIAGHIVQVAPRVDGHVLKVYVDDNQFVKRGAPLFDLDPRDLQAKLDQAQAALDAAVAKEQMARLGVQMAEKTAPAAAGEAAAGVEEAKSGVAAAGADVAAAEGKLQQARAAVASAQALRAQVQAQVAAAQSDAELAASELRRAQRLFPSQAISREEYERVIAAARSANARLEAARKQAQAADAQVAEAEAAVRAAEQAVRQAQAQVALSRSKVAQAQQRNEGAQVAPQQVAQAKAGAQSAAAEIERLKAAVEEARLQLSYATVVAPVDGWVAEKNVEPGSYVKVGQATLALVQPDVWVEANFKETQLHSLAPGQPAIIRVDAYPELRLRGRVDSIQAGTGAQFSLLPAENATGNYVKVVQRVPVKIVFEELPDDRRLAPGMSVVPTVNVK